MKYSIPIVDEGGKRYFLARYMDMRFLFRRLDAASLIAAPEGDEMDRFEVRRDDEVIIAGECYSLCKERPVFLIRYSEVEPYNPMRNTSTPHETLYADDFLSGDMIFSDVNAHDMRAKGFASIVSFMQNLDAKMQSVQQGLAQKNVSMVVAAHESFIRKVSNNQDVLGLKTFIVPVGF